MSEKVVWCYMDRCGEVLVIPTAQNWSVNRPQILPKGTDNGALGATVRQAFEWCKGPPMERSSPAPELIATKTKNWPTFARRRIAVQVTYYRGLFSATIQFTPTIRYENGGYGHLWEEGFRSNARLSDDEFGASIHRAFAMCRTSDGAQKDFFEQGHEED